MDYEKYAKYGISLRTSTNKGTDYYMVTLTFGKKWAVFNSEEQSGQKVMCAKVREDGTYCYMTETRNGLEPVFELIDATISYNEELEKKVELLKVKAEELKELFASKTYDELLRLRFVIETPQETSAPKTKRQPNSRRKTPQKPNTEPTEAIPETSHEPIGEPTPEPVSGQLKEKVVDCESSDIDKKIAEAMNNCSKKVRE